MSRTTRLSPGQLKEQLRAADPVLADAGLTTEEHRSIRARIQSVAAASRPATRRLNWVPAAVGACAVIVLLGASIAPGNWRFWRSPAIGGRVTISDPVAVRESSPVRQIHLTTPKGVRIIWIVNPDASF